MEEIELRIPESIVESLPEGSEDAERDMGRAIAGWETSLNAALGRADEDEAIADVVDLVERFEDRWESYDEFVVELRAWGQSPIYAMAWRNLIAAVVRQVYEHDELSERISRERHARIFEDGIRQG